MNDYYDNYQKEERARINIFWVSTIIDQAIPIIDFCWRNSIDLHSADYEFHQVASQAAQIVERIREVIPKDIFSAINDWVYFTLNEGAAPFYFPKIPEPTEGV